MKIVDSNLTLDELVNQITSSVDPSWSTLKQIRYVYLQLGIYLEKNEMFFMSVSNKLSDSYKLSQKEINKIYNDDLSDGSRKDWNRVICRSAAIILSKCLTKLGIENKMINSTNVSYFNDEDNNDEVELRHVFVNAKINDHESIFLTLATDLPNIQNNLETISFGNLLSYMKKDENGNEYPMYEGDEILDAVRVDKNDLQKIDFELGYLIPYLDVDNNKNDKLYYLYGDAFLDKLRSKMVKNKLYYELAINDTDLFQIYNEKYYDLMLDESGVPRLREFMIDICDYISKCIGFENDLINDFNFDKWVNDISEYGKNLSFFNDADKKEFSKLISLTKSTLDSIADLIASILAETNDKENLTKLKNTFYRKFNYLCLQFVPKNLIPDYNADYINQDYIAAKLEKSFKYVFECNVRKTEFNKYGYNEQIALIKTFVNLIFNDVEDKQCLYNRRSDSMGSVFNIIRTYTLKMKNDDTFRIIFEIDNSGTPVYYSYNLTSNKFKPINQSRFYFLAVNNIVCSKDLNDKLNIEEIEKYEIPASLAKLSCMIFDPTYGDIEEEFDVLTK